MEVYFVNLYKDKKIKFNDELCKKIKEIDNDFKILIPKDSDGMNSKNYCYLNSKGISANKRVSSNKIVDKIFGNNYINCFNELYKMTKEKSICAFVIPLHDWKDLKYIKSSYIQLTNKNVLFILDEVPLSELNKFLDLVRYLERFRNIHVGILNIQNKEQTTLYNLHDLKSENLLDVLSLHINNRRKYIGLKYHLNELRQKIKFHKDLYKHKMAVIFCNPYKEIFDTKEDIPKIIHYCWFGDKEIPKDFNNYIKGWQRILPNYKIKLWNERNFPIEKYPFAKEALCRKKWAFLADIARLHALYYEGGIYLDTDIELLKPFDEFLHENGFVSYESGKIIAMGVVGAKKYHPWIGKLLLWYKFIHCDDDYTEIANTKVVSKITRLNYKVKLDKTEKVLSDGIHIYTKEYFYPDFNKKEWIITDKTYCIHHYAGMW